MVARISIELRFWGKAAVAAPDACWPWIASRFRNGYGQIKRNGKNVGAHRIAFELANGHPPIGQIDHLCQNKSCVNPSHLEDVTPGENQLRNLARGVGPAAAAASKRFCKRGHQEWARYAVADRRSGEKRQCLVCARDQARDRYAGASA